MGDWLETGQAFGGDVQGVLKAIRARGFEPAIWVAPFIAEEGSHLFHAASRLVHARAATASRCRPNEVTFGGWRRGPWYALDGTHPDGAAAFRDAVPHDAAASGASPTSSSTRTSGAPCTAAACTIRSATRVEAYRRGMQAVLRGAGDSFILGCNHPDLAVVRADPRLAQLGRHQAELGTHQACGAAESEPQLAERPPLVERSRRGRADRRADRRRVPVPRDRRSTRAAGWCCRATISRRSRRHAWRCCGSCCRATGVAARFEDDSLRVGVIPGSDRSTRSTWRVAVFNWDDTPQRVDVPLPGPARITDLWSGADLGRHDGRYTIDDMPPHSARLLECRRVP